MRLLLEKAKVSFNCILNVRENLFQEKSDQTQIMSFLFIAVQHNRDEMAEFLSKKLEEHKKDSDAVLA